MILIDSYGWIKYFGEGPLAASYTDFIEGTNKEQLLTPTIVIYEVYKKIESVKGEERALEHTPRFHEQRSLTSQAHCRWRQRTSA